MRKAVFVVLTLISCAPRRAGKAVPVIKFGNVEIHQSTIPRWRIDDVCQSKVHVNACTYRITRVKGRIICDIFQADDEDGAKAGWHEAEHCAGGDEKEARKRDWPGTIAPKGVK